MAQKTISLGASPDDGLGDSARAAGTKINENFEELYAAVAARALKASPQFSDRTDLATPAFSASWRDDGAGNLGLYVGPAGAADGAQILVASFDKTTGKVVARFDFAARGTISQPSFGADPGSGTAIYLVGSGAFQSVFAGAALAFHTGPNGARVERVRVHPNGRVSIGGATAGAELELHALDGDQDCRAQLRANADSIAQFGVSATSAFIDASGKPLVIYSSGILFGTDATQNLGGPSNRGLTAFFQTGTINTSDAREKTPVRLLTEAERAAARDLRAEIGAFKWLDAIEKKGELAARDHIGMTVQRAIEIMESHGLDPWRYGFICRDEITRRVKVMQTRAVRATEQVEEPYDEIEIRDGVPVLVKKSRTVERPIIEMRPVLDEAGEPIMQTVLPVFGEDGALIEQEPRPVMYPVPVMVERDIEVEIDEPAGERLAFREGQLAFFMLAGLAPEPAAGG